MIRNRKMSAPALAAALLLGSVLAGCGEDAGSRDGRGTEKSTANGKPSAKPHGYVEGAEETAEQQSRLVVSDGESGAVGLLDLIKGGTTRLGRAEKAVGWSTDGRFAYANGPGGSEVFDSGAWMVDHGDHTHYYRAKARAVGDVSGKRAEHVHSSPSLTAVTFADGTAKLLDRARMEKGRPHETATLHDARRGPVVPYEEYAFVPVSGPGGSTVVAARDAGGRTRAMLKEDCPQLRGAAVTRRGAVFGCADGALFVTSGKSGKPVAEKIPFGRKVDSGERPRSFQHRSLGTTLTAKAGDRGVWVLDVTERHWKLVKTGPVIAANAAGEGAPLVALDPSGTLKSYDISDGEQIARKEMVKKPSRENAARTVVEIDANRAYVNDIRDRKIYEIDYNDDLRKARSFSLDFAPTHMVETGR
ncbi:hypothetical protein [Streptomyces axinellae]|uniref:Lipoprotein n=1 Tax=Streptomyces axinellae TaxID=552788 RepID=A0ABP6CF24_9ACTN